jgi:hypothetical protein
MRSTAWLTVVVSALAVAGLGQAKLQAADQKQSADQEQAQTQEQSRYTFHNGEWWYWLPANRWVYWRHERWNEYNPQTYAAPVVTPVIPAGHVVASDQNQPANDADIRPFYGHSLSLPERRAEMDNEDIGPFYGHAMLGEFLDYWRPSRGSSIRPFYGRAVSAEGQ